MYNLKRLSPDVARDGFYHWKLHVAAFLEKNWITLFGPQMKKRKTWLGTISGTMSHWSGFIFRSGLTSLKESGWWKLISDEPPRDLLAIAPSTINRSGSNSGISLLKASTANKSETKTYISIPDETMKKQSEPSSQENIPPVHSPKQALGTLLTYHIR